jgi:uncharacterized protein
MLDVLSGFLGELRAAGLPISLRESIDAAEATDAVGLTDRETLKSALAATVVKSPDHRAAFDSTFEVYFSIRPGGDLRGELAYGDDEDERTATSTSGQSGGDEASNDEHSITAAELTNLALAALSSGDMGHLSQVAKLAVALYGGVDSSRPVGVSYYLHRTLHGLAPEALLAALLEAVRADPSEDLLATTANRLGGMGQDVARQAYTARLDSLRSLIEAEIRRLLVAERGAAAVAKSLRRPLLEDVDFMHATADELVAMRRTIFPLARILASRLARKRRHRRKGPLDFRATIRRSMSTGGVPLEPRFKSPHVNRPELFVLADISGSVAAFARFTVHLVFAISTQFSKVRTAVFIDGVAEVTQLFNGATSLADAIEGIAREADVVRADGHSDYGAALAAFQARFGPEIGPRTNLLILGDARNNYHLARTEALAKLAFRAHRVLWLNPEPRAYWGSGDSIMNEYETYCDGVFECRNLRQLKTFVDELA